MRYWLSCGLLPAVVVCCCQLPPSYAAEPSSHHLFQQGLALERSLRLFEARETFRRVVALDPANVGYLEHYAWFLHQHGFAEEASAVFTQSLPVARDTGAAYRGLAWNQRVIGRLDQALDAYRHVLDLSAVSREDRGRALALVQSLLHRENAKRIAALRSQLQQGAPRQETLRALFQLHIDQGEFKNALRVAAELRAASRDDLPWRLQVARGLWWDGQRDAALAEYDALLGIAPRSAFLNFERGRLLVERGDLAGAEAALRQSLALYPAGIAPRQYLAEALARQGRARDARAEADAIPARDYDVLARMLGRARASHFSGEPREALALYRETLDHYPYNADALLGYAERAVHTGTVRQSADVLDRWESISTDTRAMNQRGLLAHYTPSTLTVRAQSYDNSADFRRHDAAADFTTWLPPLGRVRLGYQHSEFRQDGFKAIRRDSLDAEIERSLSDALRASARLTAHHYDHYDRLLGGVSLHTRPAERLDVSLTAERFDIIDTESPFVNPIYNHVVTIGAVKRSLYADNLSAYFFYRASPTLDLSGKLGIGRYSDGNRMASGMFEAAVRPEVGSGLQFGYNYFYLDYRDPASIYTEGSTSISAYYDPINLEVHTLFLRYQEQYASALRYGLETRLSYIPKSEGVAASVFGFAVLPLGGRDSLRIDARVFNQTRGAGRAGDTDDFRAANTMLSYVRRF